MTADKAAPPVPSVERAFCRMFEMMSADDGECVWIAVEPEHLPGTYQYTTGQTFDLAPALGDDEWNQLRDLYDAIDLSTQDNTDSQGAS